MDDKAGTRPFNASMLRNQNEKLRKFVFGEFQQGVVAEVAKPDVKQSLWRSGYPKGVQKITVFRYHDPIFSIRDATNLLVRCAIPHR